MIPLNTYYTIQGNYITVLYQKYTWYAGYQCYQYYDKPEYDGMLFVVNIFEKLPLTENYSRKIYYSLDYDGAYPPDLGDYDEVWSYVPVKGMKFVPIRWIDALSPRPDGDRLFDLLFIGWLSGYRMNLISRLGGRKVSVIASQSNHLLNEHPLVNDVKCLLDINEHGKCNYNQVRIAEALILNIPVLVNGLPQSNIFGDLITTFKCIDWVPELVTMINSNRNLNEEFRLMTQSDEQYEIYKSKFINI